MIPNAFHNPHTTLNLIMQQNLKFYYMELLNNETFLEGASNLATLLFGLFGIYISSALASMLERFSHCDRSSVYLECNYIISLNVGQQYIRIIMSLSLNGN